MSKWNKYKHMQDSGTIFCRGLNDFDANTARGRKKYSNIIRNCK